MTKVEAVENLRQSQLMINETCDSIADFEIQLRQLEPRRMTTREVQQWFNATANVLAALLKGHELFRVVLDDTIARSGLDPMVE